MIDGYLVVNDLPKTKGISRDVVTGTNSITGMVGYHVSAQWRCVGGGGVMTQDTVEETDMVGKNGYTTSVLLDHMTMHIRITAIGYILRLTCHTLHSFAFKHTDCMCHNALILFYIHLKGKSKLIFSKPGVSRNEARGVKLC